MQEGLRGQGVLGRERRNYNRSWDRPAIPPLFLEIGNDQVWGFYQERRFEPKIAGECSIVSGHRIHHQQAAANQMRHTPNWIEERRHGS